MRENGRMYKYKQVSERADGFGFSYVCMCFFFFLLFLCFSFLFRAHTYSWRKKVPFSRFISFPVLFFFVVVLT